MKEFLEISTLNLWRFNDWESRKDLIFNEILDRNFDIIFFQEAQFDKNINSDLNQIEIINQNTNNFYFDFSPAMIKSKSKNVSLTIPVEHGLGVISKYPILGKKIINLEKFEDDSDFRILVIYEIDVGGKILNFINVHFSNRDDWAENHFIETLKNLDESKVYILIGDFNIYDISKYKSLYSSMFKDSFIFKKYISYPEEKATFDYVLIPKEFNFVKLETVNGLSDHSLLITKIEI